jgi:hypothetical protein
VCVCVCVYICTALLVGRSRDRVSVVSPGTFSVATDGTMCPGFDSASKNEYQGLSLGKGGRVRTADDLPHCSAERQENLGP